jgi:hypothetical protein
VAAFAPAVAYDNGEYELHVPLRRIRSESAGDTQQPAAASNSSSSTGAQDVPEDSAVEHEEHGQPPGAEQSDPPAAMAEPPIHVPASTDQLSCQPAGNADVRAASTEDLLAQIGLSQYTNALLELGYDDVSA